MISVRSVLLGALAGVLLGGCGFGPQDDRLYPSEWKSKRDDPIPVSKDFKYEGEHWEQVVWVEAEGPSK